MTRPLVPLIVVAAAALVLSTAGTSAGSGLAYDTIGASRAPAGAQVAASTCGSLRKVKGFSGHATITAGASAEGEDPASGGTETIQTAYVWQKAHIYLADKHKVEIGGHSIVRFSGYANGGKLVVADSLENTGEDVAGDVKYNGPVEKQLTPVLYVSRKACGYKLAVGFHVPKATFEGDPEVDPGKPSGGAWSNATDLPGDLKLHGDDHFHAYVDCPFHGLASDEGCGEVGLGSWDPDLLLLYECGTLDTTHCSADDTLPIGPASFSWHLKPIFKKHK